MREPPVNHIASLERQIAVLKGEFRRLEKKIAVLRRELRSATLPDEQSGERDTALANAEDALRFFRKALELGPKSRA